MPAPTRALTAKQVVDNALALLNQLMPIPTRTTTAKQVVDEAISISNRLMPAPTYTVTAKEVIDAALIKLNYVNPNGTADTARSTKYYAIAIPMINEIQAELLKKENPLLIPNEVTTLDGTLSVSDDVATRVMPTALAMQFALTDRVIDSFNVLSGEYYSEKLPSVKPVVGNASVYYSIASPVVNAIQIELLKIENPLSSATKVSNLTDTLSVTDNTAMCVMPYAVAMQFAQRTGMMDLYSILSNEYYKEKLPSVSAISVGDSNVYYATALPIINEFQRELLHKENPLQAPTDISVLTSTLSITDDTAAGALTTAVAMRFAEIHNMGDIYANLSAEYYKEKLPSVHTISVGDTNKYYTIAIPFINELQNELIKRENPIAIATPITALTGILSITDDTAVRVMPFALAMRFAQTDQNDSAYKLLSDEYYGKKLPSVQSISTGDINKYASIAPVICTVLQAELLKLEGVEEVPDVLTSLDDALTVTDYTAIYVMPYGLAAKWSLTENATVYGDMIANYTNSKKSICAAPTQIIDVYGF